MWRRVSGWWVAPSLFLAWVLLVTLVAPESSMLAFVSLLCCSLAVGAVLTGWTRSSAGTALYMATFAARVSPTYRSHFPYTGGLDFFATPAVLVLAPALAGALVGRARRQATRLRAVTTALAVEREAHASSAARVERNRIARELHDVISHSVSQMIVQAGAAEHLLPRDDPAAVTLASVRITGRRALAELQEQLGLLRDGPDAQPLPVHTLNDIRELVDSSRARLDLEVESLGHVPAGPALAAYRVVQEALTNASRHSNGGPVRVHVSREGDDLAVEVVNGPGRWRDDVSVAGTGHGLTGMQERVALYAGDITTGRTADGGWRVHARLNIGARA